MLSRSSAAARAACSGVRRAPAYGGTRPNSGASSNPANEPGGRYEYAVYGGPLVGVSVIVSLSGGEQPPQRLPGPHALAQPADAQEFVGCVQLLVGGREGEKQRLAAEDPLEQVRRRQCAADAGQQYLLARVHRGERSGRRPDGRMIGGDGVGGDARVVGPHEHRNPRRGLPAYVVANGTDDRIGVLAGNEAA